MTSPKPSVCILTAGTGRRSGPFADIINKCLLPYKGRAIISHLIDHFSADTPFVIALGYKGEQVRAYLTLMHPERSFNFVMVDRYTGSGTGPGYSLSCCRAALQGAFYFIAGDGLFDSIPAATDKNWVATAPSSAPDLSSYCNVVYGQDRKAAQIYDKQTPPEAQRAHTGIFTGLMFIRDTETFWHSLQTSEATTSEWQIAQGLAGLQEKGDLWCEDVIWRDVGTFELYRAAQDEAFDFSKTEEFIYFSDHRVVKFFANSDIVRQRVEKTRHKPDTFPNMLGMDGQFYAYEKVPGSTAYERLDGRLVADLLKWLRQAFWSPCDVPPQRMQALCRSFYLEKTQQRLALYKKKYPHVPEPAYVNGRAVQPVGQLLSRLPPSLFDGKPVFIHGDLQFDNIITDGKRFTLIDWRQDFAGETAFGDWYYDLAKLLGGIYLNYDYIKQGLMRFEQQGDKVWLDYAVREQAPAYAAQLKEFVEKEGLDFSRVELLRGLIYLNMAPLHHPPFDTLLYALAQRTLSEVLA